MWDVSHLWLIQLCPPPQQHTFGVAVLSVCVSDSVLIKSIEWHEGSRRLVTVARVGRLPGVTAKRLVTHRRSVAAAKGNESNVFCSHSLSAPRSYLAVYLTLWFLNDNRGCFFARFDIWYTLYKLHHHIKCTFLFDLNVLLPFSLQIWQRLLSKACIQGIHFIHYVLLFLGIKPITFVLLMQCFTSWDKDTHYIGSWFILTEVYFGYSPLY